MKRQFLMLAASALACLSAGQLHAVNLLVQGDFEIVADPVPNWNLTSVVSNTNTFINNAEVSTNAPIEGTRDIFLKPYVGGIDVGPTNLTDALLSQVVPVTAGQQYTFSGQSRWEDNYSGGVTTLGVFSPAYPNSPTSTTLEMQFLNASGNPVGAPVIKDLRTEQANFDTWVESSIMGTAPAGATQLKVTAAARKMVWNGNAADGPKQAAFWDDFSVFNNAAPTTEVLQNPGFEVTPPSGLDAWTLFSNDPADPLQAEIIRATDFANHTTGGANGMWLSSFIGEVANPVDGTASQIVAAAPGQAFTFSGWSRFEGNYSGGVNTISAGNTNGDAGMPSPTQTFFEIAFLDSTGMPIGTPQKLDLKADRTAKSATHNANDNEWIQSTMMSSAAPAGTVNVRVTAAMLDGVFNVDPQQTAFFDDFILEAASATTPGDFNNDGKVNGRDFLVWQRGGSPSPLSATDLAAWQANYGTGGLGAISAVPEPVSGVLVMIGLAASCLVRGRRA